MRLSRGWRRLLLSWAGAVALCITSAGILEVLAPFGKDGRTALDQRTITDFIQSKKVVPATVRVDPPAPPPPVMETAAPTESAPVVAFETMTSQDNVVEPDPQSVTPVPVAVSPP
jgi:hypothetical protein